jgi:RHS repeat-associated protein
MDEPLAQVDEAGTAVQIHADGLGSILSWSDHTDNAAGARRYDAWGNIEAGTLVIGYGFTGREWDAEPALSYHRARYYDPKVGRFISDDPLGLAGGINLFVYASGIPTSLVDLNGLSVQAPSVDGGGHMHGVTCVRKSDGGLRCSGGPVKVPNKPQPPPSCTWYDVFHCGECQCSSGAVPSVACTDEDETEFDEWWALNMKIYAETRPCSPPFFSTRQCLRSNNLPKYRGPRVGMPSKPTPTPHWTLPPLFP